MADEIGKESVLSYSHLSYSHTSSTHEYRFLQFTCPFPCGKLHTLNNVREGQMWPVVCGCGRLHEITLSG